MTLHIFDQIEQGTEAWHDQRRGIVTASVVGKLLTPTLRVADNETSRSLTAVLAAERISGNTDPTHMSADMWRGVEDEPRARDAYSEHYAPVTEVGFMVLEIGRYRLGYSPDGLVGDNGLIEVKSRRQKEHLLTILAARVPDENMAQIQCGLLVSGRDWCDYISYCGGMALWTKRVTPDPKWFDAINAAVTTFEDNAARMVAAYHQATTGLPTTERVVELEMELS